TSGRLGVRITVAPLIPGNNQLTLVLTQHGQPRDGARISLQITMPGMSMRPLHADARARGSGTYLAMAPRRMFGGWRLTARVALPRQAPVSFVFALHMTIPAAVLKALASSGK